MNCVMSGQFVRKSLCQLLQVNHGVSVQQTRNTFVLKRKTPPPLYRKGSKPPNMRARHFIYDLVEDTDLRQRPPLNLILTTYVEGLGHSGKRITMPPAKAYTRLLLPGLAVYDTPENSQKYAVKGEDQKSEHSSPFVARTISFIKHMVLSIKMSNDTPWTLEPWHVRSAFRFAGVHMNEDCITMPNHVISGPNHDIENREFYVVITLNKQEKTPVRCRIHHRSNNVNDQKAIPSNYNFWKEMAEPIFPEDKAVLDGLPIPYLVQREMAKVEAQDEPL
ncbi:39S ribosomal protein L9, mitochondrial [Diachasma alloeum]|uniref:39S ribosomal protein L9, mitochondrial n=1 Tax=Diachasma alloeum TaxID=454923 RepID=UPI0007384E03|nr:39S ribosomal protein L9, mitochondrial [Diachasma alloeum]